MNSSTAARLVEINRDFYTRFGDSFSATRHRLQPGVRRVLAQLKGDESILDLGCGNGELARELAQRSHHGSYLGVDFSLPLLREAESLPEEFSARFIQADLTQPLAISDQRLAISYQRLAISDQRLAISDQRLAGSDRAEGGWAVVTAFAVLHHIPSTELRLNLLRVIHQLLKQEGAFVHSNWQFLNSEKLKARIQPWEAAALSASEVEAGDYLLDWRSGGKGLRYVHHFDEQELAELASASGFQVVDTFYSDGETGNLGLYQIWKPAQNV